MSDKPRRMQGNPEAAYPYEHHIIEHQYFGSSCDDMGCQPVTEGSQTVMKHISMKTIKDDGSCATSPEQLIAAWREVAHVCFDPESVTNPECATMKIQFGSIRETLLDCARQLEAVLERQKGAGR